MGEPFGKYVLYERIGLGGMAEVFRATLPGAGGIDKPCVLKRILPHFAFDPDFVRMFLEEARISILLQHGNIVPVFDFGEADGTYYLAMEHVAGKNLREVVERARHVGTAIPITVAVWVTIEVCRGLAYAHDKVGPDGKLLGLIHRDVSPSNVLVSFEGDVRLVDFGIAKVRSRTTQHTGVALKGKIPYMSPEQARGLPIDPRTDVWAVGIVLYQMLTGRRPFQGADELATLELVREGAFPLPRSLRPDVPAEVEDVVCTALAKRPQDRFDSARAMQVALSQILSRLDPTVTSANLRAFLATIFDAAAVPARPSVERPAVGPKMPGGKPVDARPRPGAEAVRGRMAPTVLGPAPAAMVEVRDSAPTDPILKGKPESADQRKTIRDPTPGMPPVFDDETELSDVPEAIKFDDETELSGLPEAVKLAARAAGEFPVPQIAASTTPPETELTGSTGGPARPSPPILLEAKKTVREVPPGTRPGSSEPPARPAQPLEGADRVWPAAGAAVGGLIASGAVPTVKERSETLPIIRSRSSRGLVAVAAVGATGLVVGLGLLMLQDRGTVLPPVPPPVSAAVPGAVGPQVPTVATQVAGPSGVPAPIPAVAASPEAPQPGGPPAVSNRNGRGTKAAPAKSPAKLSLGSPPAQLGPALQAPTGTLSVNSSPWAEVYVDGQRRAESTPVTLRLPAGPHVVRLVNPEMGLSRTLPVEIRAGETTRVAPQLR